jgi:lactate permease
LVFALTQTLVGWFIGPELPAILAPFLTIVFLLIYLRVKGERPDIRREDLKAWSPYALIIILILITRFSANLSNIFSNYPFSISFSMGPLNKTTEIEFLYTPGSLILLSAIIGGIILKAKPSDYKKAFIGTFSQILPTFLVITSMVLISNIMNYAGMTKFLAIKLIDVFGYFYPFVSPFLGAIGTFLGGSDTTSNALFGALQTEAAKSIGVSPVWLASANATGATGGKLISIQNLTLAVSGINKKGEEGKLMRVVFPYFLFYLLIMGVIIFIGARVLG